MSAQAKRGQGGQEPAKKQSREEKTQGGKEQEEGPGRLAIHARTDNWERRFRQEILVAQCARSGVKSPRPRVHRSLFARAYACSLPKPGWRRGEYRSRARFMALHIRLEALESVFGYKEDPIMHLPTPGW